MFWYHIHYLFCDELKLFFKWILFGQTYSLFEVTFYFIKHLFLMYHLSFRMISGTELKEVASFKMKLKRPKFQQELSDDSFVPWKTFRYCFGIFVHVRTYNWEIYQELKWKKKKIFRPLATKTLRIDQSYRKKPWRGNPSSSKISLKTLLALVESGKVL